MPKDLYTEWLGLPSGPRPPDHYTLLGLQRYESDAGKIRRAAERQSKRLEKHQHDVHLAGQAESLLRKVKRAAALLQDAQRKAKYDAQLRGRKAESDPLIGRELRDYKILAKLGQGRMAAVYKAKHATERRRAAIKVLTCGPQDAKRFLREAYAARTLNHPNIVTVYGVWKASEYCCIEMELVEGVSVHELLSHRRRLEVEEATQIVREVARALAMAHAQGIIHRDVKPCNILRTRRGEVKVADFGLAMRLSAPGHLAREAAVGTPEYMSPEQCAGKATDARSDIYSLGATYFQLLTGEAPIQGKTEAETMRRQESDPVPDPQALRAEVGCAVCQIIRKMMAKEPKNRYQQCDEMLPDLEQALRDPTWQGPMLAPPPLPTTEDEDTQWQDEQPSEGASAIRPDTSVTGRTQAQEEDLLAKTPSGEQAEAREADLATSWKRALLIWLPARWLMPMAVLAVVTAAGVAVVTAKIRGSRAVPRVPELQLPLKVEPAAVTLNITSDPPRAEVIIDGELRGITPLKVSQLSAGQHQLALEREGYQTEDWQGELKPGERGLHFSLRPDYYAWWTKGVVHFRSSEWEEMEKAFAKALEARPGDSKASKLLDYARQMQKQTSPKRRTIAKPKPTEKVKPAPAPAAQVSPYNGSTMILIPAGTFKMGKGSSEHQLHLPAFRISKHEITNEQWKRFVDANPEWGKSRIRPERHDGRYLEHWDGDRYPADLADHPVVSVSWFAAKAYCEWAGGRLPTEAEWEKAARGADGRKFPWGNRDPSRCNSRANKGKDTFKHIAAVGSFPAGASPCGVLDLAGNVGEWTSSIRMPLPYRPDDGRENLRDARSPRVRRGGSYGDSDMFCNSTFQLSARPTDCRNDTGVRLCAPAGVQD